MGKKPDLSFWQIWNLSFGFLGVQIGYALQNREEIFYGFDVMEPNIGGNSLHFFVEDGSTPVKTWRADEKGDPGKQFFNEAYWELEIADSGTAKIWTFHIEPDDIQQD